MKVRMLVSISGTRDGVEWPPAGSVVDVPAVEGAGLVAGGLAVEVGGVVEAAAVDSSVVESAAVKSPRRRRSADG